MTRLRKFSTSNGCQDHTTSPSASAPSVSAPEFAHGVDPALLIPCAPDAAASTASRPAFVTIASRPSEEAGRRGYSADLGQVASEISEIQKLPGVPPAAPGGSTSNFVLILRVRPKSSQ